MEDKRQVVPGLEDNRDVTTTLGVQKAKGGLGKVMGGLGSLLVLVGFVGSNLPLIVGGIVVAVVGAVLGNHAQKVGQAAISQRLVPGALHQVFETVEYPAAQDLTRAQIAEGSPGLPRFDSLYTNDVVSASYQGLPVWLAGLKLCEMALYRDPETEMEKEEEREIFLGLWFACDMGKEIGCDCTITPKGVLGRLTGSRNALGSEVFARKFQVQTDRPDWAERLLTQPVQEAMLSLLSMGKTYLRLRPDGKLTLAVSMGKPMFYLGKGSVQAVRKEGCLTDPQLPKGHGAGCGDVQGVHAVGHGDTDRVVTACNGLVGQPVPLGAQDDRQVLDRLELGVVDGDGGVAQGHGRRLEAQVVQTA